MLHLGYTNGDNVVAMDDKLYTPNVTVSHLCRLIAFSPWIIVLFFEYDEIPAADSDPRPSYTVVFAIREYVFVLLFVLLLLWWCTVPLCNGQTFHCLQPDRRYCSMHTQQHYLSRHDMHTSQPPNQWRSQDMNKRAQHFFTAEHGRSNRATCFKRVANNNIS